MTSLPSKKAYYRTDESPDVWFEPTEVWEIRGADLTVSPVHKAAVGHIHPDRGISLRSAVAPHSHPVCRLVLGLRLHQCQFAVDSLYRGCYVHTSWLLVMHESTGFGANACVLA